MNKNERPSSASELTSDTINVVQDNVVQLPADCSARTFYRNDTLTNLSPGMAQAIQESLEVSFGK
jgi:hypothetical protein